MRTPRTDCSSAPRAPRLPSFEQALRRLYALGPGRMLAGRERLARLLESVGNPQNDVPAVLVGGTNGKGSLVTALSAVLSRSRRTGAFIKPHLKSIRERWRVGDADISSALFAHYATDALDIIDGFDEEISFFEANVLLGALLFRGEGCDAAIWEVGLGGSHDACNLIDAEVSVITNVGYDHQAILGNTLAEIALDKAGIARPRRPLILGPPRRGWEDDYSEYAPVIAGYAGRIGAEFSALDLQRDRPTLAHSALQPDTLLMLEATLARLTPAASVTTAEIAAGLDSWHYRGRMERVELAGRPALLDAAHNIDSLRWLCSSLQQQMATDGAGGFPVAFGCQVSRDPGEMLSALSPVTSVLIPVEVPVLRPCPLMRIVEAAQALGLRVELPARLDPSSVPAEYEIGHITELDPPDNRTQWIECIEHGLSFATSERPLVICGSIYNMGEILRVFEGGMTANHD